MGGDNSYGFICGGAPPFIVIAIYAGFIALIFSVLERLSTHLALVEEKVDSTLHIREGRVWRRLILVNPDLLYRLLKGLVFAALLVELVRVVLTKWPPSGETFFCVYDSVVALLLVANTALIFILGEYYWRRVTEEELGLDRFVPARVDNPSAGEAV